MDTIYHIFTRCYVLFLHIVSLVHINLFTVAFLPCSLFVSSLVNSSLIYHLRRHLLHCNALLLKILLGLTFIVMQFM